MSGSNAKRSNAATKEAPDLDITRVLDAPRDLVWKAWTQPELLQQWRGPAKY